jgi:hypothetical protein
MVVFKTVKVRIDYHSQPDAVRANLACGSGQASQFMISVMGYAIQRQGQERVSDIPDTEPKKLKGLQTESVTP